MAGPHRFPRKLPLLLCFARNPVLERIARILAEQIKIAFNIRGEIS